ncbi:Uncharacterised protein [BD1-7 clade bacterium]|uniref:Uncharacterized protein n=1 Tax=BD1-7 clade bacterium TaxID=2029982 RepID=A0A5S9MW08_9GAMM|nr:Uncharacterised protein [BD1-7 clade bacterium]CAA0084537.1 Uncharacterised protein [BD1-7 clade bacterium]
MRVISWIIFFLIALVGASFSLHYLMHEKLTLTYTLVAFFLCLNLLICFWEICLFLRIDFIAERNAVYTRDHLDDKNTPVNDFMMRKVPISKALSPTVWAEIWATYSQFDGSYADRRTFGFAADIGNGFWTLIPGLIFHIGLSVHFLEARVLGLIGLLMFYQMTYMTALYWVSFIVNKRYERLKFSENMIYILGTNAPWFIFGLYCMWVCLQMMMTNSYAPFIQ